MNKPRYKSPTVTVEAECSLNEFDDEQLEAELAHRRANVHMLPDTLAVPEADVHRVKHLRMIGQNTEADKLAIDIITELINAEETF